MADSSQVVQANKSETETKQSDSVTISLEEKIPDQTHDDSTNTDSVEIKMKDDTSTFKRKKIPYYPVFGMQLVSEVMDTKIVDGSKKKTVREDVSGMQSRLHKDIQVYQGYNYNQPPPPGYNYNQPPPPGYNQPQQGNDQDAGGEIDYASEDPDERNEFVRKVFAICGVMLTVVFIVTLIVYFTPSMSEWMRGTFMGLIIFALCAVLITVVSFIYCCSDCSRQSPVNWCLNIIVTLCYCYVCSFLTARYVPFVVIGALLTTIVITLVCLGLAYTSFDFTKLMFLVVIAMVALMVASLFCTILKFAIGARLSIVRIIITIISAVLSSLMLVIEFQMILGGKSIELSMDEYVYGAYMIFTSIISMFMKMLRIIGWFTDN